LKKPSVSKDTPSRKMSFKEYTELSPQKRKLWADFNWTLKDCQKAIKEGLGDFTTIMKLEQVIGKLLGTIEILPKPRKEN